jgi:hypothetical protein
MLEPLLKTVEIISHHYPKWQRYWLYCLVVADLSKKTSNSLKNIQRQRRSAGKSPPFKSAMLRTLIFD